MRLLQKTSGELAQNTKRTTFRPVYSPLYIIVPDLQYPDHPMHSRSTCSKREQFRPNLAVPKKLSSNNMSMTVINNCHLITSNNMSNKVSKTEDVHSSVNLWAITKGNHPCTPKKFVKHFSGQVPIFHQTGRPQNKGKTLKTFCKLFEVTSPDVTTISPDC